MDKKEAILKAIEENEDLKATLQGIAQDVKGGKKPTAEDIKKLLAAFDAAGVKLTAADLAALGRNGGELSADELEKVSGGSDIDLWGSISRVFTGIFM